MNNTESEKLQEVDAFIWEVTTRKSNNICPEFTKYLRLVILPELQKHCPKGISPLCIIYGVNQRRGRCYQQEQRITVPIWTMEETKKKPGYIIWYLAHELAHLAQWQEDQFTDNHGPRFMAWLKRICPKEYQHYEIEYKPRNAVAAGISRNDFNDL